MIVTYAIDPGVCLVVRKGQTVEVNGCAVAVFYESILAGYFFSRYAGPRGAVCGFWSPSQVVVERPEQDGRSFHVRPKDLMDLAWDGAMLAASFGAPVDTLRPSQWKPGTPKPVNHAQTWERLSSAERAHFPDGTSETILAARRAGALDCWAKPGVKYYPRKFVLHNILDAVGLGLYYLGRVPER